MTEKYFPNNQSTCTARPHKMGGKKKVSKNPNAFLKAVCLRDPTDDCSMTQVSVLKKCKSGKDISNLWPGFKNDPTSSGVTSLGDSRSACDALLARAFERNQAACDLTKDVSTEQAYLTVAGAKSKMDFEQAPVTKQMLEHAFQILSKKPVKSASQQQSSTSAMASSSSGGSALAPAASSNNSGPVHQASSAISALHISDLASTNATAEVPTSTIVPPSSDSIADVATAPFYGQSGGGQTGPPPIIPANPEDEVLKVVPEVGVKRPASTATKSTQDLPQVLRTNYFKVDLKRNKSGGTHVLHEYQITGLLVPPPGDLSRSKKKVLIQRFVQASGFLNATSPPFVANAEGRVIAWRNLDTGTKTGGTVDQLNVPDFDRDQHGVISRNLSMSLVYVRTIDLGGLEDYALGKDSQYPASVAEEALNILLGQAVTDSNTGAIRIGDNHFFMPNSAKSLGGWGMVALRGFTSHVKARQDSLYLNVNTALSAFYAHKLVSEHIADLDRTFPNGFANQLAQQHLVGLRVKVMYSRDKPGETLSTKDTDSGRMKSITGFSADTADNIFFVDRFGNSVSVWEHFKNDHPAEAAKSTAKQICVNTSSTIQGCECWFLSDQLKVADNQIYRKTLDRLDTTMTTKMIEFACQTPSENQKSIERDGLWALGFTSQAPQPASLREAGISVTRKMVDVPYQVVPPPQILYKSVKGKNQPQYLGDSKWTTRGVTFLSDGREGAFKGTNGVSFLCPPQGLAHPMYGIDYINGFQLAWQMNYENRQDSFQRSSSWHSIPDMRNLGNVASTLKRSNAGFYVLALPAANSQVRPLYANFRIAADQVVGKPSLVFCEERILGSAKGYFAGAPAGSFNLIPYMCNNMLKGNVRLGAENSTTDAFGELSPSGVCDTLVLGADLIHPKATSSEVCPTIACLVGSVSGTFAKFLGSARRQAGRTETIPSTNMVAMATERLADWRSANSGRMPARILYYRDGTGITQYSGVLVEIAAIKTAWQNLAGPQRSAEVALSAVVAVKRHTTRFYPTDRNSTTSTGNCLPGTVVSSHITSPYYFDFFLQSHDIETKVGQAKPTHYFVLENGMSFSESALHQLTNAFCYNFSHSTSAVSYASPAYYADRLCERAMLYLREFFDNDPRIQALANDSLRRTNLDTAWERGGQGVDRNPWHKNFNDKMFCM